MRYELRVGFYSEIYTLAPAPLWSSSSQDGTSHSRRQTVFKKGRAFQSITYSTHPYLFFFTTQAVLIHAYLQHTTIHGISQQPG